MANLLFSTFETNPQDTGYVLQSDHYDDGTVQNRMVGIGDQPAGSPPVNFASIVSKLTSARTGVNQTYLALTSPTAAQNTAQIQALTKENNALILLLLHALTGISSTTGT